MTTALVVDDKDDNRYYLKVLLEGNGWTVVTARHGAEALVLSRRSPPDVVIADLLMPVMDGYTLLRHWKADGRLKTVPFVVYTATYTDPEDERLALSLGADAFILKPAEPDEFMTRLQEVLARTVTTPATDARAPDADDATLLGRYSETLIRKLEEKSLQLESANDALQDDIAERIAIETALRETIDHLQAAQVQIAEQAALLDEAHDAIIVRDLSQRVKFWSRGAQRLFGWTSDEAIGRPTTELVHPDQTTVAAAFAGVMRDGHWSGEIEMVTKEGARRTVESRWTLLRDPAGIATSILSIGTDVTEQRKLTAQFLRAQRLESVGTLAGGIAHDLNNVLAPIVLAVNLLRQTVTGEVEVEMLDTLEASCQRATELVRQVLSFARGVEGRRVAVNLLDLLADLLKVMRDTFPKSIEVRFDRPRDVWAVTGDPTQMHQVFLNLCVNARDAMPAGGRLTVSATNVEIDATFASMNADATPGPYVMVRVQDTGTGIPAEVRERMFEPFFTTKEIGKGTGLGLSTSMSLVKGHGGFITVESQELKGTTFAVYLPADGIAAAAPEATTPEEVTRRGHGQTILLVDDEVAIRVIAQHTLEGHGYRVLVAANGAEAVSVFARHRQEIAAVITDMAMPIMNGAALVVALRSLDPAVKVIGSSGLSIHDGGVHDVGLTDFAAFIPKPYTAPVLLGTLDRVLHGHTTGGQ